MRQVDYLVVVVVVVVASALAPCSKGALDAGGGQLLEHGALTLLLELPAALVPVLPARAQEGQHDPGNLLTSAPDALSRALDGVALGGAQHTVATLVHPHKQRLLEDGQSRTPPLIFFEEHTNLMREAIICHQRQSEIRM
jgi:hypothetical protein